MERSSVIGSQQDPPREGESHEIPRRRRLRVHWLFILHIFLVVVCIMETTKRWVHSEYVYIENEFILAGVVTASLSGGVLPSGSLEVRALEDEEGPEARLVSPLGSIE